MNGKMLKLPQRTDPLGSCKKVYIKIISGEGDPHWFFRLGTFSHDPVALFHKLNNNRPSLRKYLRYKKYHL